MSRPEVVTVDRWEDLRPGDSLGESAEFVNTIEVSTVGFRAPGGVSPVLVIVGRCRLVPEGIVADDVVVYGPEWTEPRFLYAQDFPLRVMRGVRPPVAPVHRCPPLGEDLTPCCGRSPMALARTDLLTLDDRLVTCGRSAG